CGAGLGRRGRARVASVNRRAAAATQLPAAASPPVAAQPIEDKASAKVATRDEVWRRRKWLRLAWVRNQSWTAVAEAAAATMPTAERTAVKGAAKASATPEGAKTIAMPPTTTSIFADTTVACGTR